MDIIYDLIGELALKFEKNLKKILKKDSLVYESISQKIAVPAKKIEEFIDLMQYINAPKLRDDKTRLLKNGRISSKLIQSLERFNIKFDQQIYQLYQFSRLWVLDINSVCK